MLAYFGNTLIFVITGVIVVEGLGRADDDAGGAVRMVRALRLPLHAHPAHECMPIPLMSACPSRS